MSGSSKKQYLPHQQYVIDEASDLKQRLARLDTLFKSPAWNLVSPYERTLYTAQSRAMLSYYGTLRKRIELFT